ncbi:protein kinase [bacterium]|nr:protein kinase [bacterium]
MPSFRYQPGDRPLDGFTIEQAVGRGGFGEVYYAVSDAGRQVALKAVQNFEDVELRGISHVMNLKSQHLVSIFDIKHNAGNDPFVIMEYISGPSLRDILDETPAGMGEAKAAFFLREMAKGISYLHDCDVVHRDLKPHNVFFEDGIVKIGDYSLSKLMTMSHRTGHTMTVGSVHYMAPEISLGRYDKTVDIYALGVMLYEMLTGKPPFLGESMGEVLMRHMSGEVDVSELPKPFDTIVLKAMAKDPDERYQTADEMAGAIFGHEHIQNSVAGFAPTELSFIAKKVESELHGSDAGRPDSPNTPVRDNRRPGSTATNNLVETPAPAGNIPGWLGTEVVPIPYSAGRLFSQLMASAAIAPKRHEYTSTTEDLLSKKSRNTFAILVAVAFAMFASMSANWYGSHVPMTAAIPMMAAMIGGVALSHKLRKNISRHRFILTRLATGAVVLPAIGIIGESTGWSRYTDEIVLAFLMPCLVFDWKHLTNVARPKRIMALPVAIGTAVAWFFVTNTASLNPLVVTVMAMVAGSIIAIQMLFRHDADLAMKSIAEYDWGATMMAMFGDAPSQATAGIQHAAAIKRNPAAAAHHDSDPFAPTMLEGSAAKPQLPVDDGFGNVPSSPMGAPPRPQQRLALQTTSGECSDITRPQALLLNAIGWLGVAGLHRFATGRRVSGIIWLLTFGVAGIGTLVDILLIVTGTFKDAYDRPVLSWDWQFKPENRPTPSINAIATGPKPVNAYSSVPNTFSFRSLAFSFFGLLVSAAGILFAVLIATNGTGLLKAIPGVDRDLTQSLGSASWPRTFNSLLMTFAVGGMLIGSGLMAIGRARFGPGHVLRLLFGMGAIALTCVIGEQFFHSVRWSEVVDHIDNERIAPLIDHFMNNYNIAALIPAAMFFITGVGLIAWPPARQTATPQPVMETANSPADRVEQNA